MVLYCVLNGYDLVLAIWNMCIYVWICKEDIKENSEVSAMSLFTIKQKKGGGELNSIHLRNINEEKQQ